MVRCGMTLAMPQHTFYRGAGDDRMARGGVDIPMRVYLRPAWAGENAFCPLLSDALVSEGLDVREMAYGYAAVPIAPVTIVLHWPNEVFRHRGLRGDARTLLFLARIAWSKRRHGLRVVWFAHNIVPHEAELAPFPLARAGFLRLLDGLIFLSRVSREQFLRAYPQLAGLPYAVTVHGHYLPSAVRTPTRRVRGVGEPVTLVSAGRVKRYKSPEVLAAATAGLMATQVRTVITGACDEPALREQLSAIADGAGNLSLRFGFLDDAALEDAVDAADAVIMPYRDILNSGSALFALSRGRPFIAPRLGSLIELQEQVGRDWLWLYEGEFSSEVLAAAAGWVAETPRADLPDLSAFDWKRVGRDVAGFLRDLDGARRP